MQDDVHWGDARLFRVIVNCGFCESYGEARNLIKQGAVRLLRNPGEGIWPPWSKVTDPNLKVEDGIYALRVGRNQRRMKIWNGIEEVNVRLRA